MNKDIVNGILCKIKKQKINFNAKKIALVGIWLLIALTTFTLGRITGFNSRVTKYMYDGPNYLREDV